MGDNVDYGSIQTLWPISASTAEGKLTLIPLTFFFQGYILGGLVYPWFLPFPYGMFQERPVTNLDFSPFSSCGIWQEMTVTDTSVSFQEASRLL